MGLKKFAANAMIGVGGTMVASVPVLMYLAIWWQPDGRLAATGFINLLLGFFLAFWGHIWKESTE